MDVARPLLFVRAFARAATNHEDAASYRRWVVSARLIGEFVSLLALTYLAEHNGATRPYEILLGIFFAFFVPNLVLNDDVLRRARRAIVGEGAEKSVGGHLLVGSLGVFACFATYEGLIRIMDDWRMHGM